MSLFNKWIIKLVHVYQGKLLNKKELITDIWQVGMKSVVICWVQIVHLKILQQYASIYVTFLKLQNFGNGKQIHGCQELEIQRGWMWGEGKRERDVFLKENMRDVCCDVAVWCHGCDRVYKFTGIHKYK